MPLIGVRRTNRCPERAGKQRCGQRAKADAPRRLVAEGEGDAAVQSAGERVTTDGIDR
jgi:hypothetical protein